VPDVGSMAYAPARAVHGDGWALAGVLGIGLVLLAIAMALFSPRFGDHAIAAAGIATAGAQSRRRRRRRLWRACSLPAEAIEQMTIRRKVIPLWRSTSRPPRRSASTCPRHCSPAPTR
jgi:hypothetical protein